MSLKRYLFNRAYYCIPLKKIRTNHFSLKAKVNGIKGHFILDTGASKTCIGTNLTDKFKLKAEVSETKAAGAGTSEIITQQATDVRIKIGNWKYNNLHLVLIDMTHVNTALRNHLIKPVDGIIGADILERGKAIIDYDKRRLYLKKKIFRY